ncbi:ABC transporter substrate-binding protein [Catellatospora bangladeshensis]|uniref:ABC transporter substrate-binding protein n=1 Tax=Catellatospora bangladeshensis TaxID=310355 RepID=UPI003613DB8B
MPVPPSRLPGLVVPGQPGRATGTLGETLHVALVFPMQGPAGIFGPTCELCAQLAVEEVNRGGGVLGRELSLVPVDGGAPRSGSPRRSRSWSSWVWCTG